MTSRTSGWPIVRLGEIVGRTDERRGERAEPEILTCSKDLGLIPQREKFTRRIASEDTSKYKIVRPGDFVYDANLLWSGSIARSRVQYEGIVSPVYETFAADPQKVDPRFLETWLSQPRRRHDFARISIGTNARRRKASFDDFADLELALPGLDAQRVIVEAVSTLDELVAALRDEHKALADLVRAAHATMFRIDAEERRIADMADVVSGGTPSRQRPDFFGGNVFWVKSGDVFFRDIYETPETITEVAIASSAAKLLPAKTVVVAMYGQGATRGRCAVLQVPMTTNQACTGILPSEQLNERFLFHWLWSQYEALRSGAEGTSQPNLSKGVIEDLRLPVPSRAEQAAIAESLDDLLLRMIQVADEMDVARVLRNAVVDRLYGQTATIGLKSESTQLVEV